MPAVAGIHLVSAVKDVPDLSDVSSSTMQHQVTPTLDAALFYPGQSFTKIASLPQVEVFIAEAHRLGHFVSEERPKDSTPDSLVATFYIHNGDTDALMLTGIRVENSSNYSVSFNRLYWHEDYLS